MTKLSSEDIKESILPILLIEDTKRMLSLYITRVINFYFTEETIDATNKYKLTYGILNQAINSPDESSTLPFNKLLTDHRVSLPHVSKDAMDGSDAINKAAYFVWAYCHGDQEFYNKYVKKNFTLRDKREDVSYQDQLRMDLAQFSKELANSIFMKHMAITYPYVTRSMSSSVESAARGK